MQINYDAEKITRAQQDFFNATGIDMNLLRPDFSPVGKQMQNSRYCICVQKSELGKNACRSSDIHLLEKCKLSKKAEMSVCHAGLLDVAVPILTGDTVIGYIIVGRMRPHTVFSLPDNYAKKLGLNPASAEEFYNEIPFFDEDKIKSITSIATMFVKYILLENMLVPDFNKTIEKAVAYIDAHYSEDLSIRNISKNTSASKSVLYKNFHNHFQCTVSEYIKKLRVEKSMELLLHTDLSIEEISQRVGFSSASYYSKNFKKLLGSSPLRYKKEQLG